MGFSVSGSAAIVFAGMLIAFGMWHTAAANGFERVAEAQQERSDAALDRANTDVRIGSANYGTGTLEVEATNEGSTALSLNRTDLLIDNEHWDGWQGDAELDQTRRETDLWLPGEQLRITVDGLSGRPDRVKLATEAGVAGTEVLN